MLSEKHNTQPTPGHFSEQLEQFYFSQRKIFLWGQVDENSARYVIDRFYWLASENAGADVTLFINSPGGLNTAGFAILDVMRAVPFDVATVCMGLAASFGALLLTCGTPGKRYVMPMARIMIHQPWIPGQIEAPAMDLQVHANEIRKSRLQINQILAQTTGQELSRIEKDTDRDSWFGAREAVDYGLVDSIATVLDPVRASA